MYIQPFFRTVSMSSPGITITEVNLANHIAGYIEAVKLINPREHDRRTEFGAVIWDLFRSSATKREHFIRGRLWSLPDWFTPHHFRGLADHVVLEDMPNIKRLPDGFNPKHLELRNLKNLTSVPVGCNPTEWFIIFECNKLSEFSTEFNPQGNVDITRCNAVTGFPDGFNPRCIMISECALLKKFPAGFNPGGNVHISECNALTELPEGFNPGGEVYIAECAALTKLPEGFNPQGGSVHLKNLRIKKLPNKFNPKHNVTLSSLQITELPNDFCPEGNVKIEYCNKLKSLPDSIYNMKSNQTVTIKDCYFNNRTRKLIEKKQKAPNYSGPKIVIKDFIFRNP